MDRSFRGFAAGGCRLLVLVLKQLRHDATRAVLIILAIIAVVAEILVLERLLAGLSHVCGSRNVHRRHLENRA